MYEYTDKVIEQLNRYFIRQFDKLNFADSSRFLTTANKFYQKLSNKAKDCFLDIGAYYYFENTDNDKYEPNKKWLNTILTDYNPVTKYSYENEVERKAARFAESMLATNGSPTEKKLALRYFANMVNQYAIDITDYAIISAYKTNGVKKVIWIAEIDDRTCEICEDRDKRTYDIDKIPPKPHLNCRCYWKVVENTK